MKKSNIYKKELVKRIRNARNWPSLENGQFLEKLNVAADVVFEKNSLEGYLAAVLIYHQLCEEMVKNLVECSQFIIQLGICEFEVEFPSISGNDRQFGKLLARLKAGIKFNQKELFINKCKILNQIRIEIVHKLTSKTSFLAIKKSAKRIRSVFDEVYELYDQIYDEYRVAFHHYKKNGEWDEYLQD